MIGLQKLLTPIVAMAPENGGTGETEKAEALAGFLRAEGVSALERFDSPDPRVPNGIRPNLVATIQGDSDEHRFWIMSHLDVVPPGELSLWKTDPFSVTVDGDLLYGRGVEDNQQGLVSSVFAALAFLRAGIRPRYTVKLLFVADEEVGSAHGIQFLLREHGGIFRKGDRFLVPDSGRPDSGMMEVAEKSLLWLRFVTRGKQCHASMPQLGRNAFLAASDLVLKLASLGELFKETNAIFDPPYSTFVPTKKEANVPNVNTLPGEDAFCLDCRILPSIKVDDVLAEIGTRMAAVEKKHGVTIECSVLQRVESIPTPEDAPLVKSLAEAVREVYGTHAEPVGVGGGTVAAYLRNAGYDSVVWATLDESAHMPNEYCRVDRMIGGSKVMALLMFGAR